MTDRNSMPSSHQKNSHKLSDVNFLGRCLRRRYKDERGMTLAEAMIATFTFTVGILGLYSILIHSYYTESLARYRDNARAVLATFADQFERLQMIDPATGNQRYIFDTTQAAPNSNGLRWVDANGVIYTNNPGTSLNIKIGNAGSSQIDAYVSEWVKNLDPTGVAAPSVGQGVNSAAGRIIEATFTITYTVKGVTQTQSLAVTRAAP
jgi:hypothetical protein